MFIIVNNAKVSCNLPLLYSFTNLFYVELCFSFFSNYLKGDTEDEALGLINNCASLFRLYIIFTNHIFMTHCVNYIMQTPDMTSS